VLADATRRIGEVHGRMHDRQRALDHEARVGRRRREARPRLPGRGRRLLPRRERSGRPRRLRGEPPRKVRNGPAAVGSEHSRRRGRRRRTESGGASVATPVSASPRDLVVSSRRAHEPCDWVVDNSEGRRVRSSKDGETFPATGPHRLDVTSLRRSAT
jgi:hypothetical protein